MRRLRATSRAGAGRAARAPPAGDGATPNGGGCCAGARGAAGGRDAARTRLAESRQARLRDRVLAGARRRSTARDLRSRRPPGAHARARRAGGAGRTGRAGTGWMRAASRRGRAYTSRRSRPAMAGASCDSRCRASFRSRSSCAGSSPAPSNTRPRHPPSASPAPIPGGAQRSVASSRSLRAKRKPPAVAGGRLFNVRS